MANVQDYELLLRVRADLIEAVKGMDGLSASIGGAKAAAEGVGESADQASARIKALVASTSQQVQVQESARSQAERAAATARQTISNLDAEAAATARAAQALATYRNASSGQGSNTSATALAAQRTEMAKLAAQIDPTVAALAKLDAQEQSLNALRKAGVVGVEDYTRFKAVIDQNRVSVTSAGQAMHTFSLNSSMARRELGRLASDIANGNWGRFDQTALTLANYTGLMSVAFSPLGLAIGAVVGSLGAFAVAAVAAANDEDTFNKAIAQTGNFAGVTAGQLEDMAHKITGANGTVSTSREVLTTLAASGRVSGSALQALGQAAVNMAELTGQSAQQAAAAVLKMFDGTAASALKANEQYHFLTTSVYDHIKALEEQGDTQGAIEAAADAYNQAAVQRQQELQAQLSVTSTWWDTVKQKAAGAWEEMKRSAALSLGLASDEVKLEQLNTQKAAAQMNLPGGGGSALQNFFGATPSGWSAAQEAERQALQDRVDKAKEAAADAATQASLNDAAVEAAAALDRKAASLDKNIAKTQALKQLDQEYLALWKGSGPDDPRLKGVQAAVDDNGNVSFAGGEYDKLKAAIEKQYAARKPASTEKAAEAAQQDLIKLLGDEQGALDPVAKAWATYNDQVTKANELAAKAKTAKGANVTAIDAQRDALVKLYATARDASIDKLTDKDREAWEKLRESLQSPVDVKLDAAAAKIKQLNDLLAKGVKISAGDYHDALKKIGEQGVGDLPKYSGLDAAVGGPASELEKNLAAADDLKKAYDEKLAALDAFRAKDTQNEEAYLAGKAKLDKEYAAESLKIDTARQQLTLTTMSNFFGGIAQLSTSQNRKMAAIGKTAAIAQATINTYQSATEAYKAMVGIPYIGPALATAAAAAAIVAGLANVAQIRSQPAGYSGGGYTGPGGKFEPAGIVHKGEGVLTQEEIAALGGPAGFLALRAAIGGGTLPKGLPGYANGGVVSPLVSTAGFAPPDDDAPTIMPAIEREYARRQQAGDSGQGAGARIRIVNAPHTDMIKDWANSSEGEQVFLNVIGRNKTTIKTIVGK